MKLLLACKMSMFTSLFQTTARPPDLWPLLVLQSITNQFDKRPQRTVDLAFLSLILRLVSIKKKYQDSEFLGAS